MRSVGKRVGNAWGNKMCKRAGLDTTTCMGDPAKIFDQKWWLTQRPRWRDVDVWWKPSCGYRGGAHYCYTCCPLFRVYFSRLRVRPQPFCCATEAAHCAHVTHVITRYVRETYARAVREKYTEVSTVRCPSGCCLNMTCPRVAITAHPAHLRQTNRQRE